MLLHQHPREKLIKRSPLNDRRPIGVGDRLADCVLNDFRVETGKHTKKNQFEIRSFHLEGKIHFKMN